MHHNKWTQLLKPLLAFRGQQRSVGYLFSDMHTFTGLFLNITFVDLYTFFFTINILYKSIVFCFNVIVQNV